MKIWSECEQKFLTFPPPTDCQASGDWGGESGKGWFLFSLFISFSLSCVFFVFLVGWSQFLKFSFERWIVLRVRQLANSLMWKGIPQSFTSGIYDNSQNTCSSTPNTHVLTPLLSPSSWSEIFPSVRLRLRVFRESAGPSCPFSFPRPERHKNRRL